MTKSQMFVIKRDGSSEPVRFDKITSRLQKLCWNLSIDPVVIAQKVVARLYPGITTIELDRLAAETSAYSSIVDPEFETLAARIEVSNLHKNTRNKFSDVVELLRRHTNPHTKKIDPLVSNELCEVVDKNKSVIDNAIVHDLDYDVTYFGFKTLERSYLMKIDAKIVERPQYMLMRVAIGMYGNDIDKVLIAYSDMSQKLYTHATPTLFNAGTPRPQMSSCFLLDMNEDSIKGIFKTLSDCATISKHAGGIGLAVQDIRATNSYIAGTNGYSNGLTPMLRVFNDTARYCDQGGGRRKGSFAMYTEPWHADIFEFLDLKKNHGKEESRARDLFYALWIPDIFMERVKSGAMWTLMCPAECPGLTTCHSDEFVALYERYEREGRGRKSIKAQSLWFKILESQIETGTPYMLYKDAANAKSNHRHLGTIKSSNLCTEIIQFTSPEETAVCNLASINLSRMVVDDDDAPKFDFDKLHIVSQRVTENLNKVIDNNFYPTPEARNSNLRHRPIGIGVQGLADAFLQMGFSWDSPEARALNKDIFETIYHAAMTKTIALAERDGAYESFEGSPLSKGKFQFDLWQTSTDNHCWDWTELRRKLSLYGARNSLLVAPMPTASTSQILGNNECFEPFTANIYSRRTLAGEFNIINRHLVKKLKSLNKWNDRTTNQIIADQGSVKNLDFLSENEKNMFRTVWEIPQRIILDMAVDRGRYICQSQSLNIHIENPTIGKLTSMHFYAWKNGLKTGMYYLRSRPRVNAIQFTVNKKLVKRTNEQEEDCLMCGS